jgi:16S rRNA C967 or C1407 C5-methylase (RsmB/RsmF family)
LHTNQQRALAGPAKEHPMTTRLPASQRTREELSALIEGRLRTASAKDELVKLATRLIVEEALEGRPAMRSGEITTSTVRSQARATVTGTAWDS